MSIVITIGIILAIVYGIYKLFIESSEPEWPPISDPTYPRPQYNFPSTVKVPKKAAPKKKSARKGKKK